MSKKKVIDVSIRTFFIIGYLNIIRFSTTYSEKNGQTKAQNLTISTLNFFYPYNFGIYVTFVISLTICAKEKFNYTKNIEFGEMRVFYTCQ